MNRKAMDRRMVDQRAALQVTPAELQERVDRSHYGPASKRLLTAAVKNESSGMIGFALWDCPPAIVRGEGSAVWDADGFEYIDMLAGFGVSNLGHRHPAVADAITAQASKLIHYFDLPNDQRETLAARLAQLAPGKEARRVIFGVTGSDAVELAIKAARWYTGAPIIISAYGSYHGVTGGTMATTAKGGMWAYYYPVGPHDTGHQKIPYSYPYRCPIGAEPENCADACLGFFRRMLRHKETPLGDGGAISNVAAVLLEPMQASAGYIIPGDGYLAGIREICNEHGFLLILDEIQTGMGRSGKMWACDYEGVVPDMLLTSKGLANGLPISAVIALDEVAGSWGPGAHVSTFAASALAAAAANATLDVMEQEHIPERANEMGSYFRARLDELQEKHPILGWIDQRGLFVGLEFVRDRQTKEPAERETTLMLDYCVREGLLFERGGYYRNRFQLIPSLIIDKDRIDRAVEILDGAMTLAERQAT